MKLKISEKAELHLQKMVARAEKMYAKKVLASEISDLHQDAINWVQRDLRLVDGSPFSSESRRAAYANKHITRIHELYMLRSKEQGNMTVGELIDHLSKLDRDRIVKISSYISCVTDAGTDLGGDEDHKITDIQDLETRVVISIERD